MKFFKFVLICFIIITTLFLNENIFCKITINKSQIKQLTVGEKGP